MYKTKILFFLLAVIFTFSASAQVSVSTDNSSPDNSAMMDIKSNSDNTAGYYYNSGTAASPNWQRMGAPGAQGVPGTSGVLQSYHVYGSAGRLAVATTVATMQPGMTQTFTLASPARIVVWATIGGRTTAATAGAYATVDMIIYLNGGFLPNGGWNRFQIANAGAYNTFNTCAINTSFTLPAGTHTIDLRTARFNGTTAVDIGGNSAADVNPGELTIMVLNN
jgi:hypothetical protein